MNDTSLEALRPLSDDVVEALVSNYRRFLVFLERRVGNRAVAEEILQAAFGRAVEKGVPAPGGAGVVPWFYTVLRNAITDQYRRNAAEARALETLAAETTGASVDPELRDEVCACFKRILPTLKPEYALLLQKVDLEELPVSEAAHQAGITPNNASVRLFRAREALRKQLERSCGVCASHGCLECSCGAHISGSP